jgi:hypothetical protein
MGLLLQDLLSSGYAEEVMCQISCLLWRRHGTHILVRPWQATRPSDGTCHARVTWQDSHLYKTRVSTHDERRRYTA